jgi:hypothetical protein
VVTTPGLRYYLSRAALKELAANPLKA